MHIKSICLYVFLCCLILSFFSACNTEDDDFSGVSKLIASRNAARYKKAEQQNARKIKKPVPQDVQIQDKDNEVTDSKDQKTPLKKKKFSTEIFYEEEIQIISSSSKHTLGIGTAYLNKDGKIVQIKIKRN